MSHLEQTSPKPPPQIKNILLTAFSNFEKSLSPHLKQFFSPDISEDEVFSLFSKTPKILEGITLTNPQETIDYIDRGLNQLEFATVFEQICEIRDIFARLIENTNDCPHLFGPDFETGVKNFNPDFEKYLLESVFNLFNEYLKHKINAIPEATPEDWPEKKQPNNDSNIDNEAFFFDDEDDEIWPEENQNFPTELLIENSKIASLKNFSGSGDVDKNQKIRKNISQNPYCAQRIRLFFSAMQKILLELQSELQNQPDCFSRFIQFCEHKLTQKDLHETHQHFSSPAEDEDQKLWVLESFFDSLANFISHVLLQSSKKIKERLDLLIDFTHQNQTSLIPPASLETVQTETAKFITILQNKDPLFQALQNFKHSNPDKLTKLIEKSKRPLFLMCDTSVRFLSLPFLEKYNQTFRQKTGLDKSSVAVRLKKLSGLPNQYITTYRHNFNLSPLYNLPELETNYIALADQPEDLRQIINFFKQNPLPNFGTQFLNTNVNEQDLTKYIEILQKHLNFFKQFNFADDNECVTDWWDELLLNYQNDLTQKKYFLTELKQAKETLMHHPRTSEICFFDRIVSTGATMVSSLYIFACAAHELNLPIQKFSFFTYGTVMETDLQNLFEKARKQAFKKQNLPDFPFEVEIHFPKTAAGSCQKHDLGTTYGGGKMSYMRVGKNSSGVISTNTACYGKNPNPQKTNLAIDETNWTVQKDNRSPGALKDPRQTRQLQRNTLNAVRKIMR